MSAPVPTPANGAVFLSYAREDTDAARRIADALRGFGVEVWFDQNELRGGDAWDQKIRRQIKECALFLPVISQRTQDRGEGYFRLEWKLAVERTHQMAEGMPFLAPVAIDDAHEADALVPPEFMRVHWTRLQDGTPTPQFVEQIKRLLAAPRKSKPAADVGRGRRTPPSGSTAEHTAVCGDPALQTKPRVPTWAWTALAVTVVGIGVAFLLNRKLEPPAATAHPANDLSSVASAKEDKSVAVLAFVNMSADKDTEYFSDGISEEILNALANNPALRVAARTSSFSFKGKNATADEIGRALHVASVIEGSVRRSGTKVRITVQLINAADGYHAWSETFDREMTDIFAVQDEIAAKVAQKLSGGSVASAAPTVTSAVATTKNLAAYDAYLRGRALQTATQTTTIRLEVVRLYEEAVRLDPGYALAWARLSQMFMRMRIGGSDRSEQTAAKSRSAAVTALRLAPDLPEAHLAMAAVRLSVDYDLDATQRELDEAERLRPNDPEVPATRARLERARGHWGERLVSLIARAVELDPQNSDSLMTMGTILFDIGRFAEADRLLSRSWALSQASHSPLRFRAFNHVAWTGDVRGALTIIETVPESVRDTDTFYYARAEMRSQHGDLAAAIADYEQVRSFANKSGFEASGRRMVYVWATYRMALLEARLGHPARAAELYAEAEAAVRQFKSDFPDVAGAASYLALIHAVRGKKTEALAAIDEATRIVAHTHDAAQIAGVRRSKAEVLATLGDTDAAVAELRALHEMGRGFGYTLRLNLEFEPLRADAKFQQLMKEAEARADAQPRPKK